MFKFLEWYVHLSRIVWVDVRKMKGHVQTPSEVAERMVNLLFEEKQPSEGDRILYPGCGSEGPFITAVSSYCESRNLPVPDGVALETHPQRFQEVSERHADQPVDFRNSDFLKQDADLGRFDFVISNPPYVPIEEIEKKSEYKKHFKTAQERFDLYILFFEQSLNLLTDGGRLSFITPEKFEYTQTTAKLRELLAERHLERIEHLDETTFSGYVTYPAITVVSETEPDSTKVVRRDNSSEVVDLPRDGSSWAPIIRNVDHELTETGIFLEDITERISVGVATGRDNIFVQPEGEIPPQLLENDWTYPTVSGKQLELHDGPHGKDHIICPYDDEGNLVREEELGVYRDWAELHREDLEERSCVKNGKDWYSWHENPPMEDIVGKEKLLWKDVTKTPEFWKDPKGRVLPRHSVYYLIPSPGIDIDELQTYLNSDGVKKWLEANAQRASNGYCRMQSSILKELPVPKELGAKVRTKLL